MSDEEKRVLLNDAWCRDYHDAKASFAFGYALRADRFGITIEENARNAAARPHRLVGFPRLISSLICPRVPSIVRGALAASFEDPPWQHP